MASHWQSMASTFILLEQQTEDRVPAALACFAVDEFKFQAVPKPRALVYLH